MEHVLNVMITSYYQQIKRNVFHHHVGQGKWYLPVVLVSNAIRILFSGQTRNNVLNLNVILDQNYLKMVIVKLVNHILCHPKIKSHANLINVAREIG